MTGERISTTNPGSMLPEGCIFVDKANLEPSEIAELRQSVGWDPDTAHIWRQCIDQPLGVIVGVRDQEQDDLLVGMGRLTADLRHAVLCDLAVKPSHQNLGVGKAIIAARMRITHERMIPYLYTELAPESPLRSVYEALGFVSTGNGLFRHSR
ncbi:MAG TPA: GNAT family N-acetyltransferase [Candidatus Saccharimonadales bacterium]|nr:GNAT family N-acetyltransferase [Candidatus Saccharimonadales bacterium]